MGDEICEWEYSAIDSDHAMPLLAVYITLVLVFCNVSPSLSETKFVLLYSLKDIISTWFPYIKYHTPHFQNYHASCLWYIAGYDACALKIDNLGEVFGCLTANKQQQSLGAQLVTRIIRMIQSAHFSAQSAQLAGHTVASRVRVPACVHQSSKQSLQTADAVYAQTWKLRDVTSQCSVFLNRGCNVYFRRCTIDA